MRRAVLGGLLFLGAVAAALPPYGSLAQTPKVGEPNAMAPPPPAKQRDQAKLTAQQRHIYVSGQRAMEWLQRANKPDGRFIYGFVPALRQPMEGDSYVRQAGAAFALARAARFYGDDRAAAIARQAVLTLLLDTSVDPREAHVRNVPPHQANPVAAAGILLAAIHELPVPAVDLLDQGDQLANLLRKQLQENGSLNVAQPAEGAGGLHAEAVQHYSGPGLYGLVRSQHLRPASWKLDALRRAQAYYYAYWQQHRNVSMLAWHTAAYAEAYFLTKEAAFAEAVFAMNDWLCSLQYQQAVPGRATWVGGFQPWPLGKAAPLPPDIASAGALVSLAEACRLARAAGDVRHYQRYCQALEGGLRFLTTLQYVEANTQHYADWYRPVLVGAFHASSQDGNLRLDYTQDALSALVQYLHCVADVQ
jgi:hypothetical protein